MRFFGILFSVFALIFIVTSAQDSTPDCELVDPVPIPTTTTKKSISACCSRKPRRGGIPLRPCDDECP